MIHHTVYAVFIATALICNNDGLDRAILSVGVKRLEEEYAEVAVGAEGGRPLTLELASLISIHSSLNIGDYLEVLHRANGHETASPNRLLEVKNDVLRCRARPLDTVR